MRVSAKTLSHIMEGELIRGDDDAPVKAFAIDTRTLQKDDWFIAFAGEKVDGHDFIEDAINKGCGGLILTDTTRAPLKPFDLPIIGIDDPRLALFRFGTYIRLTTELFPWYAITGSVGKTSAKGYLVSILECEGATTLVTPGNYNTDVGVPLTLASFLKEKPRYDAIVLEFAMRARGEIEYLAKMTHPHFGLITNIAPCHLETLGSLDEIAEAKGELFQNLVRHGAAVLDVDEPYFQILKRKFAGPVITFSVMGSGADIRAFDWNWDENKNITFTLAVGGNEPKPVKLSTPSKGIAHSAVAASALAYAGNVPVQYIYKGLANYKGVELRMNIFDKKPGVKVILDCYNANPRSMVDAIQVLSLYKKDGRTIAILGGMLELGDESRDWHIKIADCLLKIGIDIVVSIGKEGSYYFDRLRESNFSQNYHFMTNDEVIEWLRKNVREGDTVLIKGSRAFKLEEVCKAEW